MTSKANVLLVGGGGIGSVTALNLEYGGSADVTVILRSNFQVVQESGFTIHSIDHGLVKSFKPSKVRNTVPNLKVEKIPPFKYIICTTKNIPDVPPRLVDMIAPAITPAYSVIVLIQNGLNIEKPFNEAYPSNVILSGVSFCDSHETGIGTGHIQQDQHDRLRIGAFHNPCLDREFEVQEARDFCAIYAAGGNCTAEFEPDVVRERWRKLLYNACLASVCAITNLDSGRIQLADGVVDDLVRVAAGEICAAAKACGHTLPDDAVKVMLNLDPIESYSSPSMQVDVRKGRFCEVETIIGEPLREGIRHGVSMPTIATLYNLLKAKQWKLKEEKGWVKVPVPAPQQVQGENKD